MPSAEKPPSMVDVARRAGVAHVTVSRVLNDHPSVRPETRERVMQAIEQLGYRRNDLARALKSGRSMTIGVVIAGSELFELPRILHGVESAAQSAGYGVNLASWQGGGTDQLAASVERLTHQAVEGIAIIADRPVAAETLERMVARIPVSVVMSGDLTNPGIASIELDQALGSRLATEHLQKLGHTQIVHFTGRLDAHDARARLDGWRDAMARAGVVEPVWYEGDFTAQSGFELAQRIVAQPDRPTAIFTGNDQMAMGVLAAFAQEGVRVPEDISVVGFDDIAGVEYLVPSLTTVRQDFLELGRAAIELLLATIGGAPIEHRVITPILVPRRSSGPPAG